MKSFKISSIIIMVIGCIHTLVAPVIIAMFNNLEKMQLLTFSYMFVITGLAIIFIGWLQYYMVKNQIKVGYTHKILKVSIIFISISGIGAVATMWDNPFAYITLIVAVFQIIIYNKYLKQTALEIIV